MARSEQKKQAGTAVPGYTPQLGARIKLIIDRLGTQKDAASLVDLKPVMLGKYIKGDAKPSYYTMVTLADAAGVSLDWLATGREPMMRADAPAQAAPAAPSDIDEPLLKDIVSAVEVHLDERRIPLSPEKKSLLISELYMLMLEEDMDEHASNDLVSRLVRLSS